MVVRPLSLCIVGFVLKLDFKKVKKWRRNKTKQFRKAKEKQEHKKITNTLPKVYFYHNIVDLWSFLKNSLKHSWIIDAGKNFNQGPLTSSIRIFFFFLVNWFFFQKISIGKNYLCIHFNKSIGLSRVSVSLLLYEWTTKSDNREPGIADVNHKQNMRSSFLLPIHEDYQMLIDYTHSKLTI